MQAHDRESIQIVEEPRRQELIQSCYRIIGCMHEVHKQLGPGLPEYIYQEALTTELHANHFTIHKEQEFHPVYRGREMKAYLKMDLVVENATEKIIIECKALSGLTAKERYQTFGYLRATGWPIAILVNFGTNPKAQIERYYNDKGVIKVF